MLLFIILLTSLTNIYADILLSSGEFHPELPLEKKYIQLAKTNSRENLIRSAVIGGLSIGSLLVLILPLSRLDSKIPLLFYTLYNGFNMLTHPFSALTFLDVKQTGKAGSLSKALKLFLAICFTTSLIYSISLAWLGMTGVLEMGWFHYLSLPACNIILFQFILVPLIKVQLWQSFAGTLGQTISMLALINIASINGLI